MASIVGFYTVDAQERSLVMALMLAVSFEIQPESAG
jgi:hypothetical protein